VCAWYRKNLGDQNGETTSIGLVWDAKKFGAYTGK
jgi:hypothetical protein